MGRRARPDRVAQVATRKMTQVPSGAQNVFEWLVESLYGLLEGILGRHLVDRTFWFFATTFIFILTANWVGLIPGVGTIGWGRQTPHGFVIDQPLLRGANADLNMTLAMALVFFACWIVWGASRNGPLGVLKELFAPKGETSRAFESAHGRRVLRGGIAGDRLHPVPAGVAQFSTLRQRVCGREHARDHGHAVPGPGLAAAGAVLLLELLVGLVQALVFMLLTAVFTLLICQHEDSEPAAAHE